MDNDENLVEMLLDIFHYHLYVNDLTIYEALAAINDEFGGIVELMRARATTIGHIT
jgi:hypothetical protein